MSWTEAEVKAALTRMSQHQPHSPTLQLPSLQTQYPEEAAMHELWQVAEQHGWVPNIFWLPKGHYTGLWCEFLRETDVLRVLIHRHGKTPTRDQNVVLDALRRTRKFEVYVCEVEKLETVLTRLVQKEN